MKFSHLVQINDPLNPLIDLLSREQLWRGLVRRAEHPKEFVMALDSSEILSRENGVLIRELRFGNARIRDTVRFEPMHRVRYDTEPSMELPAATLVMGIEEPEPGQLFVRFEYETFDQEGNPAPENYYSGFIRNAYIESDVDTIYTIRRLAAEGRLGGEPL